MNKKVIIPAIALLLVVALVISLVVVLGRGDKPAGEGSGASVQDKPEGTGDQQNSDGPIENGEFGDGDTKPDDSDTDEQTKDEDPDGDEEDDTQEPSDSTTTPNGGTDSDSSTNGGATEQKGLTYEEYNAMSPTEQRLVMESFESVEAFFAWYNAAKEKYEKDHPALDAGDGSVDIGDLLGGNK